MKGKLSTKTLVIIILIVLLLAIAITGTIIFLKDSGEAAAMSEANVTERLPVAGANNQTQEEQSATVENSNISEENNQEQTSIESENVEQQNTTSNVVSEATETASNQGNGVTTPQNLPVTSTVERERVVAEETDLNWNSLKINSATNNSLNMTNIDINYNNLRYTVNYYENGELVHK